MPVSYEPAVVADVRVNVVLSIPDVGVPVVVDPPHQYSTL